MKKYSFMLKELTILASSLKTYYALSTFPDFKQFVQTCILLEAPFTLHLTFLMFEFQILLDLL